MPFDTTVKPPPPVLGDRAEGLHDADDGAVEADERRGGADGAEDPQAALELEGDPLPRAIDRRFEVVLGRAPEPLEADQEDVGER
jgi:hypothetical protein